jgi:multiple sugar transport system substrate-binding protein
MSQAQNSPYARGVSRRSMLRGAVGLAGVSALGVPALAACSSSKSSPTPTSTGGSTAALGTVKIGSNGSDPVPKQAFADLFTAAQAALPGLTPAVNTVDHNTFQQNITNYLQGTPDDIFTWFAGYRMQFFAQQGLLHDVNDVWQVIGGNFSDAIKKQSQGLDGKYYFVPDYYYPWGLFYSKSLWQAKGYTPPTTWADFITLCKKMKADGLQPVALGEQDGWPAMGTFDYLNMRTNGYDFHIQLMQGKAAWTDPKVAAAFDHWTELLGYTSPGANGRKWQDAVTMVMNGQAGMCVHGLDQAGPIFQAANKTADLDFFAFPAIDPANAQDAVEAPIDGWMMSKSPKNHAGAVKLLEWLGTSQAQNTYLKSSPNDVAAANGADTSGYNDLQKKSIQFVTSAKQISQFLDRDANPTFVSTVVIPSFQKFIDTPGSISSILGDMEKQKQSIYNS